MAKWTISTIFRALDQFSAPVTKMSKNAQRFARMADNSFASMGNTLRGIRRLAVGIGAAITTGFAAKAITDFAERGDQIARTARTLGMGAEALQELQYAAKLADLPAEDLNTALLRMNKNLGELKGGTGTLYAALKKTNPQLALQLKRTRDSDAAFTLLSDALARETDVQKRAALAVAAFGRAGQNIIPLVGDLAAIRKEARESGSIISQEEAEAGERFHETLKRITSVGRGFANQVLGKILAALTPMLEKSLAWLRANKEMVGLKIDRTFGAIGKALSFIARMWKSGVIPAVLAGIIAFKAITAGVALWTAAQALLNAAMAANPIGLIIVAIAVLIGLIILVVKNWDHITAAVGRAWSAIRDFATGLWTKVVGAFRAVRDAIFALLDNPLIKAAGLIFLPFITIPLLIAKHWDTVRATIASVIEWVLGAVQKISSAGKWVAGIFGGGGGAATGPVSPNAGMIESRSIEESRATVDVNLNSLPAGSTVKQTGRAPGFTLNTGFAFGGR